eukprot:TRINITY_DN36137_c0_g1_i1.p1 TRINITY_DN36137_c0_g1~~TRINITY_DN36137_c0_g1_i1.p1  ORF type:complete len:392 (-),score=55.12 TRINITY_DN36137_c0_g1_i1:80-1255(-)
MMLKSETLSLWSTIVLQGALLADGQHPVAQLSNGLEFPLIGLGCSSGLRTSHVASALELGYRHFDTAMAYQWGYHEHEVGDAVRASGVPRKELFIQSKIHPEDLGFSSTKRAFEVSLTHLQTDYVDSMLLHKPHCWTEACAKEPEGTWQDSWRALQDLYKAGKTRAFGICDVDNELMEQLLKQDQKPHIIQNWMDPFHQDRRIREICKKEGIQYQAYSTLGAQWVHFRGYRDRNPVLNHPLLKEIAQAHNRTVAQVVLNWAVHQGVAVIPASRDRARQETNLNSFDFQLSPEQMATIDTMDGTLGNRIDVVEESKLGVVFANKGKSTLDAFWMSPTGSEVPVGEIFPEGELAQTTHHSHRFVFKKSGQVIAEHTVSRDAGLSQHHVISDEL